MRACTIWSSTIIRHEKKVLVESRGREKWGLQNWYPMLLTIGEANVFHRFLSFILFLNRMQTQTLLYHYNWVLVTLKLKYCLFVCNNMYLSTGCFHVLELLSTLMESFFGDTLQLVDLHKLSLNFTIIPVYILCVCVCVFFV